MRILILCLFLTGCIDTSLHNPYSVTSPDIFILGDSGCYSVHDVEEQNILDPKDHDRYEKEYFGTAWNKLGIESNCVPKRQLMKFKGNVPKGKRILFITLGTNDIIHDVNIDDFKAKYSDLVYNSQAKTVYCILPNKVILGKDAEPVRNAIRSICSNVIDPLDYGVRYRAKDTVHMNDIDNELLSIGLIKVIYEKKN